MIDVGGPGRTSFVGEVVVVDLFAGDDQLFLFRRSADEEALIDQGIVDGSFAVIGGVGLYGKLDWVWPKASGVSAVVGIDCAGEVG